VRLSNFLNLQMGDFWSCASRLILLAVRKTWKHIQNNERTRSAFQVAFTVLVLWLLIWLVKSTMTDDEAGATATRVRDFRTSHLGLFDDDVDDVDDSELNLLLSAESTGGVSTLRTDLIGFFNKMNPQKVANIDAILQKYASREQLNELLKTKYGQDLDSFRHTAREGLNYKSSHTGQKTQQTSEAPKAMIGDSSKLVSLTKSGESVDVKLQRFFAMHNPEKVSTVKQLVKKYSLVQLNSKLRKKYGTDLTDDISQVDTNDELKVGLDVLERKATAFFLQHRPGESSTWVQRLVQQYAGRLDAHLRASYGYSLDGEKVVADVMKLEKRLATFFKTHNSEKLASVGDAARRYAGDIRQLNDVLREKYGIDLNGKRSKGSTPEGTLLRVNFVRPRATNRSSINGRPSRYLEELFSSIETLPLDEGFIKQELQADDEISDDWLSDGQEPVIESRLRLICIGLPFTGCEIVASFGEDALGLDMASAADIATLIMRAVPGPESLPNMDALGAKGFLVAPTAAYFYQELLRAFPSARIVIAVRSAEDWWSEAKRKSEGDWWGCPVESRDRCECVFNDAFFGDCLKKRSWRHYLAVYESFYEMVLQSVPHSRRILLDVHGGRSARKAFRSLGSGFQKDTERWIKRHVPTESIPSKSLIRLDRLHRIGRSPFLDASALQATTAASELKGLLVGLDSTGIEAVSAALSQLGLSKGPSTTKEWNLFFAGRWQQCSICEAVRHSVVDDKLLLVSGQEHVLAGNPINVLLRPIAELHVNARVVLTTRKLRPWLPELRCLLSSFAENPKESLLSGKRSEPLSPVMQIAMARLYGIPVMSFPTLDVSDYFLSRRFQSFMDSIATLIPPDKLLLIDTHDESSWRPLCEHLSLTRSCAEKLGNLGAHRVSTSAC
jgi:hypothetical protein